MGIGKSAWVYYMAVLSVMSLLRTNLPIVYKYVATTSQGSLEFLRGPDSPVAIGGAHQYYWDEALSSLMLSLLEPEGRAPTLQAWLSGNQSADGNGLSASSQSFDNIQRFRYALDCSPPGSTNCKYLEEEGPLHGTSHSTHTLPSAPAVSGLVFCYDPWAFFTGIANHIRVNNASEFLYANAGTYSTTVDQHLEDVALGWKSLAINGTYLVDYGPAAGVDGMSPNYKHVMPGCSQGNNVWMMRQVARLRELQGNPSRAEELRDLAGSMAKATVKSMYQADGDVGWFNVIQPAGGSVLSVPGNSVRQPALNVYEERHVIDTFSVVMGFCSDKSVECALDNSTRSGLGQLLASELKTSNWIRATSPRCNCSSSWPLGSKPPAPSPGWPGLVTCK
eukprot:gene3828-4218_t